MQVALNNGTAYEMPIIESGYLNGIWSFHTIQDAYSPCYYYKQGSSLGVFGVLDSFVAAVDALNNAWSRPSALKGVVDTLSAFDWHSPDYFEEGGEGYDLIQTLNATLVWIIGSFEEGGTAMCKVGSKYTFVSFDGKYVDTENDWAYYSYYTGCAELYGEWLGCYSVDELQFATLCLYTDINYQYPPIWIAYQPDGYLWSYLDDWEFNIGTGFYIASWMQGNIQEAMDNPTWLSIEFGTKYFPQKPFKAVDNVTYTPTMDKGLKVIGYSIPREGYSNDGRNLYGGSMIDQDDNPFSKAGYNSNGKGGQGDWDGSSDQGGYTTPDQFTIDALSCGLLTVYNPTEGELKSFNDYIFTDIDDAMANQLKKLIADPIDYVIFLAMCHFQPTVKNAKEAITFCGLNTGVTANVVSPQMQFIQCGTIHLSEHNETASFLSYDPYFKAHLYLPYIGMVDIAIDDIMDCDVSIQYIVDMLTGSCVAQVLSKRTSKRVDSDILNPDGITIGEYTGNCFENLPLSATDWRGLFQGVIQFAGGLTSVAGGNVAGLGAMASAVMSDKVSVSRSGQLGANYGYMGFQKPYFLFERVNPAIAGDILGKDNKSSYGGWQGWTCNIIKRLGNFKGYTEVRPECLWTDSINGITEDEAAVMKELFSTGVYLNWN